MNAAMETGGRQMGVSPGKPRQSKAAPERGGGEKLLECKSLQF